MPSLSSRPLKGLGPLESLPPCLDWKLTGRTVSQNNPDVLLWPEMLVLMAWRAPGHSWAPYLILVFNKSLTQ